MSSAVMSLSICFEIFALRFSAALGIARTSSALRSLARKFRGKVTYLMRLSALLVKKYCSKINF